MEYLAKYESPLGEIVMAANEEGLVGLWFDGQKYLGGRIGERKEWREDLEIFEETRSWLDAYFRGEVPDFTPRIVMRGSEFRKAVWKVLLEIPYGHTMTYGEIGRRIASERGLQSMSAQAIGGAVGHNPISIIVPCHRVIGADGALTGYAGGIERKKGLLRMEGHKY